MFSVNNSSVTSTGSYIDADFLDIYDLKFIEGNPAQAFKLKKGIVITKTVADILFENPTNLLGKIIRVNKKDNFKITGVVAMSVGSDPSTLDSGIWQQFYGDLGYALARCRLQCC